MVSQLQYHNTQSATVTTVRYSVQLKVSQLQLHHTVSYSYITHYYVIYINVNLCNTSFTSQYYFGQLKKLLLNLSIGSHVSGNEAM